MGGCIGWRHDVSQWYDAAVRPELAHDFDWITWVEKARAALAGEPAHERAELAAVQDQETVDTLLGEEGQG